MEATVEAEQVDQAGLMMQRAHRAADRAVEVEGPALAGALGSGNVTEIEQAFYRVFRRVYLEGYTEGRADR